MRVAEQQKADLLIVGFRAGSLTRELASSWQHGVYLSVRLTRAKSQGNPVANSWKISRALSLKTKLSGNRCRNFTKRRIDAISPAILERNARRNGWEPGGSVMIHGLPNVLKRDLTYYQTRDWTDGCIAVSNSDMLEIWLLTADNAPIEILP